MKQAGLIHHDNVLIPAGNGRKLGGELIIPENCESLVIFSHGSGSSRFSPRNNFIARLLHQDGIGTFLFDLLTEEEDRIYETRFNIDLLTERLIMATRYISKMDETAGMKLGYFGASTGAASALRASVAGETPIYSIVCRGGRPDLAMDHINIKKVRAATLLIVGELDYFVLELNKAVYNKLDCAKSLEIVPGATHLFEEPGTLDRAADLATDWFNKYLQPEKIVYTP